MKKKILSLGVIAILIIMLFALTGCGNNNQDNEKLQNDNMSDNQGDNIVSELEFKDIEQPYKDGYAILWSNEKNSSGNPIYYFVDSNGKVVYKEGIYNLSHHKFMNGYYIRNYYNSNIDASIIDLRTGKTVLSGTNSVSDTESVSYGDISENGYVVAVRKTNTLAGESYKTNIEDLDGNVIYSVDKKVRFVSPTADIFVLMDAIKDGVVLVNAKTKKSIEVNNVFTYLESDEILSFESYIAFDDVIVSVDLEKVYEKVPRMVNELNDQYYLSDKGITDFSGNVVHEFKDGGFSKVFYYDGTYYVLSNNDFRYTLDESFNFVAQPDHFYKNSLFTLKSNGVLSTGNGIGIRDRELNKIQGVDLDIDTEDINDEMTCKYIDEFVYISEVSNNRAGATKKVYNLKTDEFITFHK